jgi:hypothetical protein
MRVSLGSLATSSLLLALVSFGLTNPANAAAPKAGASCAKAGASEIVKGKKFTCTKSGKKLTWNKGVAVSNTKTSPTDAFAIYGKDAARFKAVDEYGAKLVSTRVKSAPSINTILQSPTDPAVIRMTTNAQYAFSVYEQLISLGYTPKWIVGEDGDWVKGQLKDVAPCMSWLSPNQGGAGCHLTVVWRAISVRDDATMRNTMLVQGGHEIFHLYQTELLGDKFAKVPDWLREGSASVGMGIVLTHFEDRKSFANYGAAQEVERSPKDKSQCEAALNKWEKNLDAEGFGNNNGCEYGLGLLMNEYLIMKGHTLNDVLEIIRVIGNGSDFPTAFQQVYKISTTEFFTQFRAYLKTLNYGW